MAGVPDRVREMAELPAVEDLILPVLREAFPDVSVVSLIADEKDGFPFILARHSYAPGNWRGDPRFFDVAVLGIHTFTEDPDGDGDGALLSEAVRVALRDAAKRRASVPGIGTLHSVTMTSRPRRVSDWATSSGPVQYADLPTGTYRYETLYRVVMRRPGT